MNIRIRDAVQSDRQKLANLIHFEEYVHRHLDWKPALDWLGSNPYVIAEIGNEVVGTLACPVDPPGIAWVRLFAVASAYAVEDSWQLLWDEVKTQLIKNGCVQVYALALQAWFTNLLLRQGFEHEQDVVVLVWEAGYRQQTSFQLPGQYQFTLRPMQVMDIPSVREVDRMAFGLEWQNSQAALRAALEQSAIASVIEFNSQIIGYQISTSSTMGGHLARLAVSPSYQGRGAGTILVHSLLAAFQSRGIDRVTVNTQANNHASLAIYQKIGFQRTGEYYPVFRLLTI